MKSFDELEIKQEENKPIDKTTFQKQRLLLNVARDKVIIDALNNWLLSFEGGISKELFMKQVYKLDWNNEVALQQIEKSRGKRSISKPHQIKNPLPVIKDIVQELAENNLFIAVAVTIYNIKEFVRNTYQTLKPLGNAFVLDLDDLRVNWVTKFEKGNSEQTLKSARDAEFLIIIGYEIPQDLARWIGDAVATVIRYRISKDLPIILTFNQSLDNGYLLNDLKQYVYKRERR